MKDNPAIVADLVEVSLSFYFRIGNSTDVVFFFLQAIDFSRRTGARLAIVGLELAGTHVRRAPETRGFDSGFDPNMLHDINHNPELTQADVHWRLQRQDLVEAVEHAARAHAKVSGVEQYPFRTQIPNYHPITDQSPPPSPYRFTRLPFANPPKGRGSTTGRTKVCV